MTSTEHDFSGDPARPKSRSVESNQQGVHDGLQALVAKHLAHDFQKPVQDHNRQAFDQLCAALGAGKGTSPPWIFDTGCGTGDSTRKLARDNPGHMVIGVDKSLHRLSKERGDTDPTNMVLIRADLVDMWRLVAGGIAAGTIPAPVRHYILYPNPWPKADHLARRWHGHPVFPDILRVGGTLELRTNWKIYADEFALALKTAGMGAAVNDMTDTAKADPLTPFEAKYSASGQRVWNAILDTPNVYTPKT